MIPINVGFNDKAKARELGAKVIDGRWCIPDSVSDENKSALLHLFCADNHEKPDTNESEHVEKNKNVDEFKDLETVLTQSTLHLLLFLKEYGFPKDVYARERIFRRLARKADGDYPVSYEDVVVFLPVISSLYPEEAILNMIKKIEGGHNKDAVESCKKLSPDERGLLLFLLP